jgi:hypothetical protein
MQRIGLLHGSFEEPTRGEWKQVVVGHQRYPEPIEGRTRMGQAN